MSEECEQQACPFSPFCLGMCNCPGVNLTPLPQNEDRPSTVRTCAERNKILPPSNCFNFASEDKLVELANGHVPANTACSTEWVLKVFQMCKQARNKRFPFDGDLFETGDPSQLTIHLS